MASAAKIGDRSTVFSGWRILVITFVVMNLSLGVNFMAYGSLVEAIQREFDTSRALAAAGPSILNLSMGLMAPFAGSLMHRVQIRTLMLIGVTLNVAGFVVITQLESVYFLLAAYALMIGPGFCLSGVIPCTTIVSNWFVKNRGRAIGLINIPLGNTLMPLAAAMSLQSFGLRSTFLGCAIVLAALIPLILCLVDRPERINQMPYGAVEDTTDAASSTLTTVQILRLPKFWVLTLGIGLVSGGGMVIVSHLVALGTGRGLPLPSASFLLAGFGLAGLAGAPTFGWIADKFGGGRAFAILCAALIPPWLGLIFAGGSFPALLVCSMLIGGCSGAITTLFGTTIGEWLGSSNVGVGMGLCYLLQIPFLFLSAPLAGAMFDATQSYSATILLHVASFAVMAVVFLIYRPAPTKTSAPRSEMA